MKQNGDFGQIKELLDIIKDKIDKLELFQSVTTEQTRTIKDQLSVVNKKLDSQSASLINIDPPENEYSRN